MNPRRSGIEVARVQKWMCVCVSLGEEKFCALRVRKECALPSREEESGRVVRSLY